MSEGIKLSDIRVGAWIQHQRYTTDWRIVFVRGEDVALSCESVSSAHEEYNKVVSISIILKYYRLLD